MRTRLFTPREGVLWVAAFLLISAILVATRFTSTDPDSALYASISGRLAQEPPARWIAPQWWGFWPETKMTGLFREHPSGVFLLPAAVGQLGIPGEQAAYIVGIGAGLASLLLLGILIECVTSAGEARSAIVLLQLMPVAFLFRLRANHEYPMLVALLVALVSVELVRRSGWWTLGVVTGCMYGLLVKGVFVVLVVLAVGLWIVINPTRVRGTTVRVITACVIAAVLTGAVALWYDAAYLKITGEAFWGPYWQRQLGPVTIATPLGNGTSLAGHIAFYLTRLIWFPAPWSVALLVAGWRALRSGTAA